MLFDELERDFEPLEAEPARHAAALAMYALMGQKCSQRMTDGAIPKPVLDKTFSAWPRTMVAAAIADLVALGLWEQTDADSLAFVDWDLRQYTREQEERRRLKTAERQRKFKHKTIAESGAVTPLVTPSVTVPSSSSSSRSSEKTSSLRSEAKETAPPRVAERKRSTPRSKPKAEQALEAELKAQCVCPPQLTNSQAQKTARRLTQLVETGKATDLESAARLLVGAWRASGRNPWGLLDVDPFAAHRGLYGVAKRTLQDARNDAIKAASENDFEAVKKFNAEAAEIQDREEREKRGWRARA
jgi:hypothetical protein